jgi:hypothetical protein
MKIEELWPQLEAARAAAASRRGASGWVMRQLRPESACPLHVAVELSGGRRGLLLRIEPTHVPPKRRWPICRGLDVLAVREGSQVLFGVALKEERHADVFTALAEDLARRITAAADADAHIAALLVGLARWQKFLAARGEGLGVEAQRGLWAELHFLRTELVPIVSVESAVSVWQGPSGAAQDFLLPGGAVEVKATSAKPPFVVLVSSERQLDSRGLCALFLRHYALAEREGTGESLPDAVAATRSAVAASGAVELFEDRLLEAGYLDAHSARYEGRGWRIRATRDFAVRRGFPRLIERDLPSGVGSVRYGLALAACETFAIPVVTLRAALAVPAPNRRR